MSAGSRRPTGGWVAPGLPASEAEHAVESIAADAEGKEVEPNYNPLSGLTIKGGPFVTKANVGEFEAEY